MCRSSLLDGARAWYWNFVADAKTTSKLLQETPNFNLTLGFCKWFSATFQMPGLDWGKAGLEYIQAKNVKKMSSPSHPTNVVGLAEFK